MKVFNSFSSSLLYNTFASAQLLAFHISCYGQQVLTQSWYTTYAYLGLLELYGTSTKSYEHLKYFLLLKSPVVLIQPTLLALEHLGAPCTPCTLQLADLAGCLLLQMSERQVFPWRLLTEQLLTLASEQLLKQLRSDSCNSETGLTLLGPCLLHTNHSGLHSSW